MGLRSGFLRKNSRIQGKKRSKVGHLASIFDAVAVDFYQKYRRKPIADSLRVICACAREFQPPRAAVEQAQAERVFQRGNAARQGGPRYAKFGGGAVEPVGLDDFDE